MPKVFINYRRGDSKSEARLLFHSLANKFGEENVLMDIDTIPPGTDFKEFLENAVEGADFFLALVGPSWLEAGNLEDPRDWVRVEIEAALAQGKTIIPITVNEGAMPSLDHLPESLHPFTYRNGLPLDTGRDFDHHVTRIGNWIERLEGELKAQQEAEEQARREAEEKAKREAEERAQMEAKLKAEREAHERAMREAEKKAQQEAEQEAQRRAEENVRLEAAVRAQEEANETAVREAEETARREVEEMERRKSEEKAQREAIVEAAVRRAEEEMQPGPAEPEAATKAKPPLKPEGDGSKKKRPMFAFAAVAVVLGGILILVLAPNSDPTGPELEELLGPSEGPLLGNEPEPSSDVATELSEEAAALRALVEELKRKSGDPNSKSSSGHDAAQKMFEDMPESLRLVQEDLIEQIKKGQGGRPPTEGEKELTRLLEAMSGKGTSRGKEFGKANANEDSMANAMRRVEGLLSEMVENPEGEKASATTPQKREFRPILPIGKPKGSAMELLFPLYGVTLGKTTVSELKNLGVSKEPKYPAVTIEGVNFWFHNDPFASHMYLTRGEPMPEKWAELGFNWELSYDDWRALLDSFGWPVSIIEQPTVVKRDYLPENSLKAKVGVTSERLTLEFLFDNGTDGTDTSSIRTLYSITLRYR